MPLRCGIVGLPNTGKSTLFNALTAGEAAAENYPFCTIDPNIGVVGLADPRLDRLARISGSARTVPATVEFTDIAGLVKGAASGEGLGNKFLSHIRETDATVHIVRCYEDADVVHVQGTVDPVADAEMVEVELALADLATVEKAAARMSARARIGDADARAGQAVLAAAQAELEAGRLLRRKGFDKAALRILAPLCPLTLKPALYVANIKLGAGGGSLGMLARMEEHALKDGSRLIALDAKLESELQKLDAEARTEFLEEYGLERPGLKTLAHVAFELLGLQAFFTSGPQESRAWVVRRNCPVEEAAGAIHTDMRRGFIKAEVVAYGDFVEFGGMAGAREAGRLRQEGKGYLVREGDVILVRFSA